MAQDLSKQRQQAAVPPPDAEPAVATPQATEAATTTPTLVPLVPTDKQLAQLKAKWGEVLHVQVRDAAVLFRQYNEAEWDKFQNALDRGGDGVLRAQKNMTSSCVVWSSKPLDSIIKRRPAYGKKFWVALMDWCASGG